MSDAQEREAFERWVKNDSTLPVKRDAHGYADFTVALMWHVWRAARKTNAPGGALGGEPDAKARLGLAAADSACVHDFALQPSSGMEICRLCGRSSVGISRASLAAAPAVPEDIGELRAELTAKRDALVRIGMAAVCVGWSDGELSDFVRSRLLAAPPAPPAAPTPDLEALAAELWAMAQGSRVNGVADTTAAMAERMREVLAARPAPSAAAEPNPLAGWNPRPAPPEAVAGLDALVFAEADPDPTAHPTCPHCDGPPAPGWSAEDIRRGHRWEGGTKVYHCRMAAD